VRTPTQRPESAIKNPDGDGPIDTGIKVLKWGWGNVSGLIFGEPEGDQPVVVTPTIPKTSDIPD